MNFLFLMSGSISCYKAVHVISQLRNRGHHVKVAATPAALQFVGVATLEGVSGHPVFTNIYEAHRMMDHIKLIQWADRIILCPATANTINKLAAGIGDDAVSTLALAADFSRPFFIAPAMNTRMLNNPITHASLKRLQDLGCRILHPESGALACGETGDGRLMEPEKILELVGANDPANYPLTLNILITAGGTVEPIDAVRSITNTSTGATGIELASLLAQRGAQVTLLSAESTFVQKIENIKNINIIKFKTFLDLSNVLKSELSEHAFDVIIHAAAVSDFAVADRSLTQQKIESSEKLTLSLTKNPKLIEQLKFWSKNKNVKLIGFKLTVATNLIQRRAAVQNLIERSGCDFVVANDLSNISETTHEAEIYNHNGQKIKDTHSKRELAHAIVDLFLTLFPHSQKIKYTSVVQKEIHP